MADEHDVLMNLIMQAVRLRGGRSTAHPKYLPEVLALVCRGKLKLLRADQELIVIEAA